MASLRSSSMATSAIIIALYCRVSIFASDQVTVYFGLSTLLITGPTIAATIRATKVTKAIIIHFILVVLSTLLQKIWALL